jgi:hypothetical protein
MSVSVFIEGAFVHQRATLGGNCDIAGDRVGFAEITTAGVQRVACIPIPIHKEAVRHGHAISSLNDFLDRQY